MTDWLLDTLLATSALILLVLLMREPVRKHFGSRVTYGLWLIPAARLFMPTLTQTVERTVPAETGFRPPLHYLGGEPLAMAQVPEPALVDQLGGWPAILIALWLAVAATLFVSRLIAFNRDRRAILASSVRTTRVGSIRLVGSPEILSPVARGILRPIIAVPADFEALYAKRERRLVLEHELAHHRSGDILANLFAFVLLCLQWFNPLAWAAHAAFRFDQEAACDARVLDKVKAVDRVDYGRAIAKAASGRALLFASALDRPTSLQRRLKSMLRTANPARRLAGRVIIVTAAAVALPLTATRAIEYVAVAPSPASRAKPAFTATAAPAAAIARASFVSADAPVAAAQRRDDSGTGAPDIPGVTLGKMDVAFFGDDTVYMNGKRQRLEQLSPAERSKLRSVILKSQREIAEERAKLPKEMAELQREADRARSGALKQEYLANIEDLRRDLARVDRETDELRAAGEDPEKVKAEIREGLREAQAVDIDKEVREAMEEANPEKILAELTSDEQQMARMLATLDQLGRR